MKTCLFAMSLLVLVGVATATQAQSKPCKLTITLSNVVERKGSIRIGLITKAENFMGKSEIDTMIAVPASGPVTVTFASLPAGTYAARLYQDLNDNKQLDMENGRPAEPFGFSKITMLMGPPAFEDASFELTADTELKIILISL